MDCSTPAFLVPHHLLEFTQVHVHWIGDAIQPSHSLLPPSQTQSFPASGSFPMNQLFKSGGQSVGASTSASVQYTHTYFYTLSVREHRRNVTSVAISTTLSQILVSVLVKWNWTLWPLLPTFSACLLSVEKRKPKHKFNQRTEKMQKQRKTIQQD